MSVFIPGYAQRGKVSVLLVDVKKNTNAWITHGSVTRIDHGTMEKYWAAKLSCHIRFGPVGEFRLFGVLRQKEMRWGIFEQKRFWKVDKKALVYFTGMHQGEGQVGQLPHQILADQKAPPGSGGAPHYYLPHQIFDP